MVIRLISVTHDFICSCVSPATWVTNDLLTFVPSNCSPLLFELFGFQQLWDRGLLHILSFPALFHLRPANVHLLPIISRVRKRIGLSASCTLMGPLWVADQVAKSVEFHTISGSAFCLCGYRIFALSLSLSEKEIQFAFFHLLNWIPGAVFQWPQESSDLPTPTLVVHSNSSHFPIWFMWYDTMGTHGRWKRRRREEEAGWNVV